MIHKLFIVAAGNTADHTSLQRALAGERNVTIIYDRRRAVSGAPDQERRRRTDVDEQLRTRGWAVVRTRTSLNVRGMAS
jgi:hypothetical protein